MRAHNFCWYYKYQIEIHDHSLITGIYLCLRGLFKIVLFENIPGKVLKNKFCKDTHLATVVTTLISTDITRKLYDMNSKLRTGTTGPTSDVATGRSLDIRLPGIAGKLSQMDSRQLELFCESQKKDLSAETPHGKDNWSKFKLVSTFKAKMSERKRASEQSEACEIEPVLPPPTTATSKLLRSLTVRKTKRPPAAHKKPAALQGVSNKGTPTERTSPGKLSHNNYCSEHSPSPVHSYAKTGEEPHRKAMYQPLSTDEPALSV